MQNCIRKQGFPSTHEEVLILTQSLWSVMLLPISENEPFLSRRYRQFFMRAFQNRILIRATLYIFWDFKYSGRWSPKKR